MPDLLALLAAELEADPDLGWRCWVCRGTMRMYDERVNEGRGRIRHRSCQPPPPRRSEAVETGGLT